MTREEFYRAINCHISRDDQWVIIHSSLLHFNVDWKVARWELLAALRQLINEGITIVVPCFTFSFCNGVQYHHLYSKSEVGLLGDWFRLLDGVIRTNHPIYSFAACGPRAIELLSLGSSTTFGIDSPFALWEQDKARLIMFGNSWKYCTQLHHQEELAKVPYRYYKTFTGSSDFGSGLIKTEANMYVRNKELIPVNNFDSVIQQLRQNGSIYESILEGATITSTTASLLGNECKRLLLKDKYAFVEKPNLVRYRKHNMESRNTKNKLKVALIGQSNLSLVKSSLQKYLENTIQDQDIEVFIPPFGQSYQLILDLDSSLWSFNPDFIFFIDRPEDIYCKDLLDNVKNRNNEQLLQYINIIKTASSNTNGSIYVNSLEFVKQITVASTRWDNDLNTKIYNELSELKNVLIIDINNWYTSFSNGQITDERLWFMGRFPYSKLFSDYLSVRITGVLLSELERTTRLIVVDLDNTLWGGVLGEGGIEELQVGGDYPGNAFLYFQKAIKNIMDQGIALAIVSKNDEDHALQAIDTIPSMQFNINNMATWRINWKEKWCNIIEIAEELGIGLENILFIDDSPVEREKIRHNLPYVKVLEMPTDPTKYASTLLSSPYIEKVRLNKEDLNRSKQYVNKRKLEKSRMSMSADDFLTNLQPVLYIAQLSNTNTSRASQLVAKTNQFNTTATRYTKTELEKINKSEHSDVYVLGLEDRFTDREDIGVAVIHWNEPSKSATIKILLLSCRILGRGVETGFLAWLCYYAKQQKIQLLTGSIVETERNTPVRKLYKIHGFLFDNNKKKWILDLTKDDGVKMPSWINVRALV